MRTNDYFDNNFRNYNDDDKRFRLGNKVLYKLVEDYPSNTNYDEIVAKFWIIGRTYAAAIERRSNKDDTPGDFYYDYVAPTIANSELESRINDIKNANYSEITEDVLKKILSVHGYLVNLIKGITGKEKRSLASKYLHFHLPNLVFIYDSRVASVIGKFIQGNTKGLDIDEEWDSVYARFAYKAFEIYKKLKDDGFASAHGDTLPRVVDSFLLRYCDEHNVDTDAEE